VQGTQTNAPAGTTSTDAASAASKGNVPLNSITAGGLYTGHVTERTTFATVGLGQVEVGGELLTAENDPAWLIVMWRIRKSLRGTWILAA
jgi:hypothetical protein